MTTTAPVNTPSGSDEAVDVSVAVELLTFIIVPCTLEVQTKVYNNLIDHQCQKILYRLPLDIFAEISLDFNLIIVHIVINN